MSLRARLTIVVIVAVLLAGLGITVAGSFAVRRELRQQVVASAELDAYRVADRNPRLRLRIVEQLQRTFTPDNAVLQTERAIRLVTRTGIGGPGAGEVVLPVLPADVAVAEGRAGETVRTAVIDGRSVLVVTVPAQQGGAVMVAHDLGEVDATVARLRRVGAFICAIAVLLAALIGSLVTRRALRPVEDLTDAIDARHRAPDDLTPLPAAPHADEVGRLTEGFNGLLAALAASRAQQRALVADASHELRTPITSLRTSIELLHRAPDLPVDTRTELVANAVAELEELTHLVDEIVLLASGEAADGPIEDCALDDIVTSAVERARRRATGDVTLDTTPCTVRGRAALIERAVSNLLENARKWSPAAAPIEVTVAAGRVTVRDHGPGVPPEDRERVFDRFARGRDAEQVSGSGLGLAIVRAVATEHGGRAWLDAAPDGGTIAVLEFPT